MHYYDFNIADYRADTGHLKPLEHYIYRTLMDTYYLDERPIPKETQSVLRRLGLASKDEATALQNVLNDFFHLRDDGYHHGRIDAELVLYRERAAKNRQNGKNGGRPKTNKDAGQNPVGSESVSKNNPLATDSKGNQELITNNHKPIEKESGEVMPAGLVCLALKESGIVDVNPAHPRLLALLNAGATVEEFKGAASTTKVKRFSYILGMVEGMRKDALTNPQPKGKVEAKEDIGWMRDDSKIVSMANELKISTVGKSRDQLIIEIRNKLDQKKKGPNNDAIR